MTNIEHVDQRIERIRKIKRKRRNKNLLFIIQLVVLTLIFYCTKSVSPYIDLLNHPEPLIEVEVDEK